jgi:hypothetical protein
MCQGLNAAWTVHRATRNANLHPACHAPPLAAQVQEPTSEASNTWTANVSGLVLAVGLACSPADQEEIPREACV